MTAALEPRTSLRDYVVAYDPVGHWTVTVAENDFTSSKLDEVRSWLIDRIIDQYLRSDGTTRPLEARINNVIHALAERDVGDQSFGVIVGYDVIDGRFMAWRGRSGLTDDDSPRRGGITLLYETYDEGSLRLWLWFSGLYLSEARYSAEAEDAVDALLEPLAKAMPYAQMCLCADYARGLVANDCHVHNEAPRHFVGDYDFACTCP